MHDLSLASERLDRLLEYSRGPSRRSRSRAMHVSVILQPETIPNIGRSQSKIEMVLYEIPKFFGRGI